MSGGQNAFVWCTYRAWSFQVLESLLDLPGWRPALLVTTHDCRYDFSHFEACGVEVLRIAPERDLAEGGAGHRAILQCNARAVFHLGWSWLVPPALLDLCPNVTLHPGKLPLDRGGSPIQNQIRNGETWSYANLMLLGPQLDAGPVYLRQRFSLEGDDIGQVWARMISAGAKLCREFLLQLAAGVAQAVPQEDRPSSCYRRVKPSDAVLSPSAMSARKMYDIIRAHNETDPNTYVRPALLPLGTRAMVIERASLGRPPAGVALHPAQPPADDDTFFAQCHEVNDGAAAFVLHGADGTPLYLSRVQLRTGGRQ